MKQTVLDDKMLLKEIKQMIQSAKQRAAVAVNSELTLLYWQVGNRISQEVLKGERAEYGEQIIIESAADLTAAFGKGWSKKQLHHCLRFAQTFTDEEIVYALRRQLGLSRCTPVKLTGNTATRPKLLHVPLAKR